MALTLSTAVVARADFPYLAPGSTSHDPDTYRLPAGAAPSNFGNDWKLAATPEAPSDNPSQAPAIALNNSNASQLCGVRGSSVVDDSATMPAGTGSCIAAGTPIKTAFQDTTGRPDVVISVLDSGIEWNNAGAMTALRRKVHLNPGELPAPWADLNTSLDPGVGDCAALRAGAGGAQNPNGVYDLIGNGAFNVTDYACDSRVAAVLSDPRRLGPKGMLTPQDLILAFGDCQINEQTHQLIQCAANHHWDNDGNGFANDIAGWNFVDNDNDPYDDVQYGHGTGEAEDSNAEADAGASDGQELGVCPNCEVLPLRVGESFIADANRFAQAVLYATDMGVDVIQEALGSINDPVFARQAIEYAYDHGTAVIGSAADEAAEHHNEPANEPDVIVVNSVTKYASISSVPFTPASASYLQLNGCTNFTTKVTVSVPSSSCSSEATGKGAGVAGLIYSAAEDAHDAGRLAPSSDCHRVDGSPCLITPNEVRQLMASGHLASSTPADEGDGGQADDVDFMSEPEPSCTSTHAASTCTDPNSNFGTFAADDFGPLGVEGGLIPTTREYPARKGFDEFYGYGRLNAYNAVNAVYQGTIPPEADITSPDWFRQIDPKQATLAIGGHAFARGAVYTCELDVAPGGQPNNAMSTDTDPGDFQPVPGGFCDGHSPHTAAYDGTVGSIDLAQLAARFPASVQGFDGNENGGESQTSNGRPNTLPYAFTVRLVVRTGTGSGEMTGEDRRQLNLHRDRDMLSPWPMELRGDGDSSPLLVDLTGSDRNDLLVATSDGQIHAFTASGKELPGWPVHTDQLPLHTGERAYKDPSIGTGHYAAVLGALAAGDLFGDGRYEIVADDNDGNVYAWDATGHLVFHQQANPDFSGAPLSDEQFVRKGVRDRTEHGFLASPVLADLTGNGQLDIVAAGEDRHVYAWQPDGRPVPGFPVEVYDHDKASVDNPTTGHLTFNSNAAQNPGIDEDQGKIVDTPAIAYLDGPGKPPSIVVGTNEEYAVNSGDEGPINAGSATAFTVTAVGQTGVLGYSNSRLYVLKPTGDLGGSPYRAGWPVKIGIIDRGLLPDVGEGITGTPVVGPVDCPNGGSGPKIAAMPDAGLAYVLNPDGSSCYGKDPSGADNTLEADFSAGTNQYDHPAFAAVGNPAFGSLNGSTVDVFAPEAGLMRAVDIIAPDYQPGQDLLGAWNASSGQYLAGYPTPVNDLQFLTGPVVGQILAGSGQDLIEGTASQDLQAFNASGQAASSAWPKLSHDWIVATPALGSFGTLDTQSSARKDVISITRSGTLSVYGTPAPACSPSSWPRYHHDLADSGDYYYDAVHPGVPMAAAVSRGRLEWVAPGNDLLCGTAARYQVATSAKPITPQNFTHDRAIGGVPAPKAAGTHQSLALPSNVERYVAIRAVGVATESNGGQLGLPAVVDTRAACVSRRNFSIRLPRVRGQRVVSAVVSVNRHRVRVVRGRRLRAPVNLVGLPKGTFTVQIAERTSRGRTLRSHRTYHTCVAKRKVRAKHSKPAKKRRR